MNKKVVVIGHGMVGHRFVQVLRERDATDQWQVTVLGEEADAAYDRVALSSYIDSWDRDTLALTGNDYAEDPMVTLHLGDPVVGIDRTNQTVSTAAGTVLDYDALVMATGSGVAGIRQQLGCGATPGVSSFRSWTTTPR
ncbi:Probable nitrite reductase [Mycobacteroides abscessus subsp. abscessus]|nr:Probable nitrite reductase [Mycobacteroides abscessus subsp. abscessus]